MKIRKTYRTSNGKAVVRTFCGQTYDKLCAAVAKFENNHSDYVVVKQVYGY